MVILTPLSPLERSLDFKYSLDSHGSGKAFGEVFVKTQMRKSEPARRRVVVSSVCKEKKADEFEQGETDRQRTV